MNGIHRKVGKRCKVIDFTRPPCHPWADSLTETELSVRDLTETGSDGLWPSRSCDLRPPCLPQTGTLTESELCFGALVPAGAPPGDAGADTGSRAAWAEFQEAVSELTELDCRDVRLPVLAACHGLTLIDGKPHGDPLDLPLFYVSVSTSWAGNMVPKDSRCKAQAQTRPGSKFRPSRPFCGAQTRDVSLILC